ncbi:RagB/SusD family nutrient uptake outer membrane protein [Catalinimonas alkaloidigena]|nr:RagB/SusD family nutrient uptake outer membrane protein [Catalinimonas alkaloidigena]
MKKRIILVAALALMSQSCEKILEEEIVSGITAGIYYKTPQGWKGGVNAVYETLRYWYGREEGFTFTTFGTDTYTKGADGSYKYFNDYDGQLNAASGYFSSTWREFYQGINTANTVIDRADAVEGLSETDKVTGIAEARALRALYYFILVQTYGPIHLTLEETTAPTTEANRTPVDRIYSEAIVPDLDFAIANLPATTSQLGRVTKPVAQALRARVAAVMGDWTKVEEMANAVINEGGFSLLPRFIDLWDISNDKNQEIIWSVQYTADPLTNAANGNAGGNRGHLYFLSEYDQIAGMKRDIANGRPWKRFQPTMYLLTLFERGVDSRYEGSFKDVFYVNNAATAPAGLNVGDTAYYVVPYAVPDEIQKSKPYFFVDVDPNATDEVMKLRQINYRWFPTLRKHLDPLRLTIQQEEGRRDFPVIRLAEMYLLLGESLMMQGRHEEAAEAINVVRRRAAFPGQETAIEIDASVLSGTGDHEGIDFILDERARELVGEMHRWFDLKRTGKLIERVQKYNPDAAQNIQNFHLYRPIPQDQLDRVSGGYQQNEGYGG